ncbi:MAG TPA: DinB family protein [Phycisphaerales bacterium]|nr:DinB family protein [Phycisphaerales bacterium]
MPTRDSYDTVGVILSIFSMVAQFVRAAVEDVPESRMTEQPGTIVNHPAWTLAHLNAYAGLLLSMLGDPSVPEADAELARFGYGSTPVPDPAAYPSKRELLVRFDERHARLAAVVAEKHAEYFPRPAPEKFQPFSPTIGHVAIILLTAHPGHHLGQLRQWRRAAGLVDEK